MAGLLGGRSKDGGAVERQLEEQKKENERLKQQQEEERRELSEQAEARRRSRTRGGSRMLLSGARVNPEEGVTTLGSVGGES
jgi:septal ring factor EnvC (AmiA/AmiB activator)